MGTRALAVLSLLAAPSFALAQFGTVDPKEINRVECTDTAESVDITFTINSTNGDRYDVYAQAGNCDAGQTPSATPVKTSTLVSTVLRTVSVSPDVLRDRVGITDCNQASDVTYYVCVYLMSGSTIQGTAFSDGSSKFQLAVPPAPIILGVAPANQALDVTLAQGTPTATEKASSNITFQAVASAAGYPTVTAPATPTSLTGFRVAPLVNNVPYTVVAYAFSSAGNKSAVSASATGTPLPFLSFWENYQNAGGGEQGGCGGGAGALSLLALLPLALRRRRP